MSGQRSDSPCEVYNRTRRELLAAKGVGWCPSAVERLAALGDPNGVLATLIASYDRADAALAIVLNDAGIMSLRGTLEQIGIDTEPGRTKT